MTATSGVPAGSVISVAVMDLKTTGGTVTGTITDSVSNSYINWTASQSPDALVADGACGFMTVLSCTAIPTNGTITYTPLSSLGGVASAFYVTGTANVFDTNNAGNYTYGSSASPSFPFVTAPLITNTLLICMIGTYGPSGDTFIQDTTNGAYKSLPQRVGIASGLATIAGGYIVTSSAITYAPSITSRNFAMLGFGLSPNMVTGVAGSGQAGIFDFGTSLYANRIRFTTTTTGTGTISLGTPFSMYQIPRSGSTSGLVSGTKVGYCIVDGNNWEVGTGTYTLTSPATLTRTTVEDSSSGPGVLMNLSGSATVSFVATAAILNGLALTAGPTAFTGIPTVPTPADYNTPSKIATTAFIAPAFNDVGSNKIHNPLFNIAQRGTGAFTTGGYTLDRWYVSNLTDTISVTQVALADADRTAIGDEEAQYALQNVFTGNSGTAYNEIFQRVENVRRLSNKTVTVSFWAKASSGSPNIGVSLDQNMGTGGSPSSSVFGNGVAIVLSTTWTRYSSTFTLGSLSGLTLGTNNDHSTQLNFWFSSGTTQATRAGSIGVQSATIQLWGVQFEIESFASQLEKPDPRYDLTNCQRFYQIGNFAYNGYTASTVVEASPILWNVTMRAAPSVTPSFTTQTNCASSTTTGITANGFSPQTTGSSTAVYTFIGSYTASADL